MTTAAEGMELTRVGPGTPMGELMRLLLDPGGANPPSSNATARRCA